jgi:DNA end-binding protein Ku
VKGYEFERSQYVTVTEDDLRELRPESTRTIHVQRFVSAKDLDRLHWSSPYFMTADGKVGLEAFAVIRQAMKAEGQVALGRVVMSNRERLLAREPRARASWPTSCARRSR